MENSSEELRAALIKTLDEETEEKAREAILQLLENSEPGPASYANQEREIQRIVQKAKLNPEDKEVQAQLKWLYDQGMLDPTLAEEVGNKEESKKGKVWLTALGSALILFPILVFLMQRSPEFDSRWGLERFITVKDAVEMGMLKYELDSTTVYNNQGVAYLNNGQDSLAVRAFEQALQSYQKSLVDPTLVSLSENYATYNLNLVKYKRAKSAYIVDDLSSAVQDFEAVTDSLVTSYGILKLSDFSTDTIGGVSSRSVPFIRDSTYILADSLYLHSLHGLGLVYLANGEPQRAQIYLDSILTLDSRYFDQFGRSLFTMMGPAQAREQQRDRFIQRADSLFDVKDFAGAKVLYERLFEREPDNEGWLELIYACEDSLGVRKELNVMSREEENNMAQNNSLEIEKNNIDSFEGPKKLDDLKIDLPFFESQAINYQGWLEKSTIGRYLKVHDLAVETNRISLYLEFKFSALDSIVNSWDRLDSIYSYNSNFSLEQTLYYNWINMVEVSPDKVDIQVYDTYDLRREPLFFRAIYYESRDLKVEKSDPKSKIAKINFNLSDEILDTDIVKLDFYSKISQQEIFEKILQFVSIKYARNECSQRSAKIVVLEKDKILRFRVQDICREVLADDIQPDLCSILKKIGFDCNWAKRELLIFTVVYQSDVTNKKIDLQISLDGKYGSGMYNNVRRGGYLNMKPEFDKYLKTHAINFSQELSNYLKNN